MKQHESKRLIQYLNLKLAALGEEVTPGADDVAFVELARPLLRNFDAKDRLLSGHLCPVDARIQAWLDAYLSTETTRPRLPSRTLVLDQPGLARTLSLPLASNNFSSPYLDSYRLKQGVLHNPRSDRRTTQGVFHIAEGGLPVPADKQAVPRIAFARLLEAALQPPADVLGLPYTANAEQPARLFVSLLIRPLICPATERDPEKRMEIRFFAPGSLVSNLDFVESIFGNAGDPHLPENNSAADLMHWSGHSGCVILAPHIVGMKKAALGLPHVSVATARQKRDGMSWESEDEPYNGGNAFKICARDERGVIVTVIADNYYGYCKKEVKTQISFAANLFGLCEEEHAGGAIAFASYILGNDFDAPRAVSLRHTPFAHALKLLADKAVLQPGGYAVDSRYSDVYYVPEDTVFNLSEGTVKWGSGERAHCLTLAPSITYVLPSGFRVRLEKQVSGSVWRLVGSRPRGILCHKPCTVSGGGKSEISKSIANALLRGPVFVHDYQKDMDDVAAILKRDFSRIWKNREPDARSRRDILSTERTLGSVIQLMSPSPEYTDEHNAWVRTIHPITRQLVFTVKRYYRPEWGGNWREHFTVDRINGIPGHELKFDGERLISNYLRVGYDVDGSWRIYKLRPDFFPAEKVQVEDDITASVVVPATSLGGLNPEYKAFSVKLVENCETLLFQRPDDAIKPGADAQAEADLASSGTFISNFEALSTPEVSRIVGHVVELDRFTAPMKTLLEGFLSEENGSGPKRYMVCSARPRLVDGKPSKNPRYLQRRPDLAAPRERYLAEIAMRLDRDIPADTPVHFPVNAVLGGRRNTLADEASGLPPLAVYGPIHYQELPELFMEFVSSLTGKSPATTGFGSEGALTKGPFNALWPVVDLNNALVSSILTGEAGFTTSAGYIGPRVRVDHDISLLVPEIWCRMRTPERDPKALIEKGFLEKIEDFTFNGRRILASRLGYRITPSFVDRYLGRMFENPGAVLSPEMLRPEQQDLELFVDGMEAIVESQRRVALNYFVDGSVEAACPPLKALLHIMAHGQYEGNGVEDPEIRRLFTLESMLASDWYAERLRTKQQRDEAFWSRYGENAAGQLARVVSPEYLKELVGTIGADPFHLQIGL